MAQHDPFSKVREQAIALKIGRQKRIKMVDGQPVEVYTSINEDGEEVEDEEEEEEEELEDEEEDYLDEEQQQQAQQMEDLKEMKSENPNEMLVNVEGEDGQQYVVLEVIQIQEDQTKHEFQQYGAEQDPLPVDGDFLLSDRKFLLTFSWSKSVVDILCF